MNHRSNEPLTREAADLWRRLALASGLPVAAWWVLMTALTGRTYHLAPLVITAAPGVLRRWVGAPAPKAAVAAGALTVAVGWLTILLLGIEPSATLWTSQPGGVRSETAAFALLGLSVGAGTGPSWLLRRAVGRGR